MNVIKILSKEIGEYKKDTILTPLFMIGEVAMECLIPAVMAILIDHMYTESISMVVRYGLILIALALISLFCGANSARAGARAGAGFAKNLRRDLFYRVQDYSFKDIDEFSSASLVTRLTHDVSSVQNSFQMIIRMAVRAPLMLIFSVVMAIRINSEMALIFFAIIPVLAIGLYLIFNISHPMYRVSESSSLSSERIMRSRSSTRLLKKSEEISPMPKGSSL